MLNTSKIASGWKLIKHGCCRRIFHKFHPEQLRMCVERSRNQQVFTRHFSVSSSVRLSDDAKYPICHGADTTVHVYNSLTSGLGRKSGKTEPLLLMNKDVATWYACGPTVYDSAHIGHASSYVRFDIIRRILSEFFKTTVVMVMGITDIDDKIIQRAQQRGVKDFREIARHYEEEFYGDMRQLNVWAPTVYTRVSDHIPHIISFIINIMENGYGYATSNGSVYFDVGAFTLERYNKLTNQELEVDGDESREVVDKEKRHPRDFALWKGAKPGEPCWESPWGKGRPGWHIECSAMSSAIFGECIDIHTGGRDLAFPHHNNEIAQCEACFSSDQWVNYFLHSGQLYRKHDENKMSKSLKNTVSIGEFLESHTSNQFRILCLMSKYNHDIEYGPDTMQQSVSLNRQISAFLNDAEAYIRGQISCPQFDEAGLMQSLANTQQEVMQAFADDFDTKRALDAIMQLVQEGNAHFSQQCNMSARSPGVVAAVSTYVYHVLTSLGLQLTKRSSVDEDQNIQAMTTAMDTLVGFRQDVRRWALDVPGTKNLDASEAAARKKDVLKERAPLLKSCDEVRDQLARHGIQIKDRGKTATWEFVETSKQTKSEGSSET